MKLNKNEENILIKCGCQLEDISQIKRLCYKFTLYDTDGNSKKISMKDAKLKLSKENFLSGLERAAFHRTSFREVENKKYKGILIESNLF